MTSRNALRLSGSRDVTPLGIPSSPVRYLRRAPDTPFGLKSRAEPRRNSRAEEDVQMGNWKYSGTADRWQQNQQLWGK